MVRDARGSVLRYILRADPVGQAKLLSLVGLGVLLGLAPIHLFRLILDRAIPRGDTELLWRLGGALLALTVMRAAADYRRELVADNVRSEVIAKLRRALLAHVLRLGPEFFARTSVGQITTRIQLEVGRLGMSVANIFVEPIIESTTFIVYAIYLLTMNPSLTLLALTPLPFVALVAPRVSRRLTEVSKQFGARTGEFSSSLQESVSAAFEVQVHGTYAYEQDRVGMRQDRQADRWHEMTRQHARLSLLAQLTRGVGPIVVYMYGAVLAIRGDMAIGEIVAFAGVLGGLYASLEKLIRVPPILRGAQDRFDELHEYLELPRTFVDGRGTAPAAPRGASIALRDVAFSYDDRPILESVSLDIAPGERVAFVGRSGCGKSTALNLICGRLRARHGEVRIDGASVEDFSVADLTATVGVVAQTPVVFSGTLRDNLLYALMRREGGLPEQPASYLELEHLADPEACDRALLDVCRQVALEEDLVDLGLEMRAPAGETEALLELRAQLADRAAADGAIERFSPDRYIESGDVAENVLFAADDDGEASEAELRAWTAAAERAGIADMIASQGHEDVSRDLSYLQSVAADAPELLRSLGTDADDIARRSHLVEQCRGRTLDGATLGPELFHELVRRGLLSRDVPEHRKRLLIEAREPMRRALGNDAPPAYDVHRWNTSLCIRDNLLFGRLDPRDRSAAKRVRELLHAVLSQADLLDAVRRTALGFHVGERGSRLSGGQRQKVSLARVLLKTPRVVLLDEVTSALDQAAARQVFDLFTTPAPARTVVAITHQLAWLDRFDRVVVFDGGRIVAEGTRAELVSQAGLFRDLEQAAGHAPYGR